MAERMPRRSTIDPAESTGPGGVPLTPSRIPGKPGMVEVADMVTGPLYDYLGPKKDREVLRKGHNPRTSKSQKLVEASMREVFAHPPSTLGTNQTKEARRKQQVAIGLSKARARGARIPRKRG